jgi:hypothetical protein
MEQFIVNKYGKEVGTMIFALAENMLAMSEQFGRSFGLTPEARMAVLSYAVKLNRDVILQNMHDDTLEIMMQIQGETNEDFKTDKNENESEGPDLDFTKDM